MEKSLTPSIPAPSHRQFSAPLKQKDFLALGGVTRVTLCDPRLFPGEGRGPELSRHCPFTAPSGPVWTARLGKDSPKRPSLAPCGGERSARAGFPFFNPVNFVKFTIEGAA